MRTFIVELDTGRFGDWLIVTADTAEDALRQHKRRSRRRVLRVREFKSTKQWRAEA